MEEGLSTTLAVTSGEVASETNVLAVDTTAMDFDNKDDSSEKETNVMKVVVVDSKDNNESTSTVDDDGEHQEQEEQQHSPGDILRISRISLSGTGSTSLTKMKASNRFTSPPSTSKIQHYKSSPPPSSSSSSLSAERIRQQILSQAAPRVSPSPSKSVHRNVRQSQQHEQEEQEQEQMNEQVRPVTTTTTLLPPGERLYVQAMNAKAQKERKWKLKTIETKKQAQIRVSLKTRVLASAFWTKKLRELAERFPGFDAESDSIPLDELIECIDRLGLAIKTGVASEAIVASLKKECCLQQAEQEQLERMDLKRVEGLIRTCLDNGQEEYQLSCSRELVDSFKQLFTCPVKKPIDLRFEDKFHSIQEPKMISAREFVLHLEEEMRESQRRRHLTLEAVQKEMERDLTFHPKITKIASNKKAPPPSSSSSKSKEEDRQVHLRLYREAESRKKRLEESVEKQSKQELNEMLLECSFQPSINDFEQSIFMLQSLNDQSILDSPDECIHDHLNRMERARLEREEKEERLRQLGSLKSTSSNRKHRTVSARLFTTKSRLETSTNKPANPPLAILDVIVAENMRVSIELFAGDDPEAIADEFATVYHLGSIERDAVANAIHSAIQNEEEHSRNQQQAGDEASFLQNDDDDEHSRRKMGEGHSSFLNGE